jgi:hypothetical protein
MFGPPGTEGQLVVDFSSTPVGGAWTPANVGAVWIEWVDPSDPKDFKKERFVRTLEKWAETRLESLETWSARACTTIVTPDVVSTATLADHKTPHHSTWDTKDINGQVVPDGQYKVYIEVTEFEEQGPVASFEFTKGPTPQMPPSQDGANYTGLKISYTPGKSTN